MEIAGGRKCGPLTAVMARGLFWVRLGGYGVLFRDARKRWVPFSERNGMRKMVRLGPFIFRLILPEPVRVVADPEEDLLRRIDA